MEPFREKIRAAFVQLTFSLFSGASERAIWRATHDSCADVVSRRAANSGEDLSHFFPVFCLEVWKGMLSLFGVFTLTSTGVDTEEKSWG